MNGIMLAFDLFASTALAIVFGWAVMSPRGVTEARAILAEIERQTALQPPAPEPPPPPPHGGV